MASLIQVAMRRTFRPSFRLAMTPSRAHVARIPLIVRSMSAEGQIQSELMESMKSKISAALNAEKVQVTDIQGDGRHVEIVVVSKDFEGKSAVNRQRMVYKAIWEELQDVVHAVDAMVTQTPDEAGGR